MNRGQRDQGHGAWAIAVSIALIAGGTLAARSLCLDHRPFHGDEANQAYKTGKLLESGRYVYDPTDHHGPTLYYLALIPPLATGTTHFDETEAWMYRIVPVLFSAGTLLLLIPLRSGLGGGAALCGALLVAVSPAFTFYARYFIQETLLVFFTLGAVVCAWRYAREPRLRWALGIGTSLSLMHATKETAVLAYAALAVALIAVVVWQWGWQDTWDMLRYNFQWKHVLAGLAVAIAISVTLFSAFFTHWRGPLDSVLTYGHYFERAGGAGIHDKPWYYYLDLLSFTKRGPGPWWSELHVLILGAIGFVLALTGKGIGRGHVWFLRFWAIYTVVVGAMYSAIPYKTPWSMLTAYFGIVLLAGVAVAAAMRAAPGFWRRIPIVLAFAVVLAHQAYQSYQAETIYAADVRNPYVYAHTSTAFSRLVTRLEDLAAVAPAGRDLKIMVIQPDKDYWPLPWYLRRFNRVGYWHATPEEVEGDVIIADPKLVPALEQEVDGAYFGPETHGLRPGVLRAVYIRQPLWEKFLEARTGQDSAAAAPQLPTDQR